MGFYLRHVAAVFCIASIVRVLQARIAPPITVKSDFDTITDTWSALCLTYKEKHFYTGSKLRYSTSTGG